MASCQFNQKVETPLFIDHPRLNNGALNAAKRKLTPIGQRSYRRTYYHDTKLLLDWGKEWNMLDHNMYIILYIHRHHDFVSFE